MKQTETRVGGAGVKYFNKTEHLDKFIIITCIIISVIISDFTNQQSF